MAKFDPDSTDVQESSGYGSLDMWLWRLSPRGTWYDAVCGWELHCPSNAIIYFKVFLGHSGLKVLDLPEDLCFNLSVS